MFIRYFAEKLFFVNLLYLLYSSQVSNNKKKYLVFLFHRFLAICIQKGTLGTLSSMI